jgi:hypothetical protein
MQTFTFFLNIENLYVKICPAVLFLHFNAHAATKAAWAN